MCSAVEMGDSSTMLTKIGLAFCDETVVLFAYCDSSGRIVTSGGV
jgi:hypothetical protein